MNTAQAMAVAVPLVLPGRYRRLALALMAAGMVAVAAGLWQAPERTWANLLLGNVYLLSVGLFGALFLCFQFLSGAGWSAALRRVPEAMMSGLPVMAAVVLALSLGRHALYPEGAADAIARGAPLSPGKALYLSPPLVLLRTAVVLGVWALLAWRMRRESLRQDADHSLRHHHALVRHSAVFAVVFAVSWSIASVDWLMSLAPHWSSTIFAVYVFAGLVQSGLAVTTLMVLALRRGGPLQDVVGESHLHDLGKLLLTFSTFWAYIWLSQYLLIWYGNLPEEVTHYASRTGAAWIHLFVLNLVVNWAVPFLVLLPRASKRKPAVLAGVCLLILAGRWLDLYLLIMPETFSVPAFGVWELLIPLGYAGMFLWLAARALAQAPLLPLGDPFLEESLHHHA
jgi:hypothetical protein